MAAQRKGNISVETGDIFPVIKKWLYSEHDIFLRELISNATDAITKRASEARVKNQEIPTGKIEVIIRPKEKTITVKDNGIGMDEKEVEKYIAKLAFSGAEEFVKKIKDSGDNADIIGKFGLGFYSVFMVSGKVVLESLSMQEGAKPVKWTCKGQPEYTLDSSTKSEVGTSITLHLNKDGQEFLDEFKAQSTLRKFCDFMPYEISVVDAEKKIKPHKDDGTVDEKAPEVPAEPSVINQTEASLEKRPFNAEREGLYRFFSDSLSSGTGPSFLGSFESRSPLYSGRRSLLSQNQSHEALSGKKHPPFLQTGLCFG